MDQLDSIWNGCSPELLILIFQQLDIISLRNCLFVNNKWKGIAEYTLNRFGLWQTLVEHENENRGASLKTKSNLDWGGIFENSQLWWNVREADISQVHSYKMDVRQINVYKDNLIVVTSSSVTYFNIETFDEIKAIYTTNCVAFKENDHMVLQVTEQSHNAKTLTLYGKITPGNLCIEAKSELEYSLNIYKMEGNLCYAMSTNNILICYKWEQTQWQESLRARYYGRKSAVLAIHFYDNEVYILLDTGQIMRNDNAKFHNFVNVYFISIPHCVTNAKPVLCYKFSAVFAVNCNNELKLHEHEGSDNFTLECPGLSCAVEHGHVLLLAYTTGKIEVCIPKNMKTNGNVPEFTYHVKLEKGDAIQALDVYEAKGAHHLLVLTLHYIHQLLVTHPHCYCIEMYSRRKKIEISDVV